MQRYKVRRAAKVTHDLDLIEEYLVRVYQDLGDDLDSAMERATSRINEALAYIRTFEDDPYSRTEHPEIRSDIRTVSSKRFIFYCEVDETLSEVRVLAVFFGGVDHRQQILDRFRH